MINHSPLAWRVGGGGLFSLWADMCVNCFLVNLSIMGTVREHGKPLQSYGKLRQGHGKGCHQVCFLPGCLTHKTAMKLLWNSKN